MDLFEAIERITQDGACLFCTVMRAMFQAIVNDIVKQGAQEVRVVSGHGGYFSLGGNRPMISRKTDAAEWLV